MSLPVADDCVASISHWYYVLYAVLSHLLLLLGEHLRESYTENRLVKILQKQSTSNEITANLIHTIKNYQKIIE